MKMREQIILNPYIFEYYQIIAISASFKVKVLNSAFDSIKYIVLFVNGSLLTIFETS